MQKLGALILIFLVLLAALPCTEVFEDDCLSLNTAFSTVIDGQKDHSGQCESICTCNCCLQNIVEVNLSNLVFVIATQVIDKQTSNYQSILQEHDSSIWNPPKIA